MSDSDFHPKRKHAAAFLDSESELSSDRERNSSPKKVLSKKKKSAKKDTKKDSKKSRSDSDFHPKRKHAAAFLDSESELSSDRERNSSPKKVLSKKKKSAKKDTKKDSKKSRSDSDFHPKRKHAAAFLDSESELSSDRERNSSPKKVLSKKKKSAKKDTKKDSKKSRSDSDFHPKRKHAAAFLDSESELSSDRERNSSPKKVLSKKKKSAKKDTKKDSKKSRSDSDFHPKRKHAAAFLDSESELSSDRERNSPPKKVLSKKKKSATKDTKKDSKKSRSKSISSVANDLFGDDLEKPKQGHAQPLWSSQSRRVAGGVNRQAVLVDNGDVFVDVRVYNTVDILNLTPRDRSDKWSAQLRLQLDHDDPIWQAVKGLFSSGRKRFNSDPTYYPDGKK